MEYNQESRNKPIHLWSTDFQTRLSRSFTEEIIVFLTNGDGIMGYPHARE